MRTKNEVSEEKKRRIIHLKNQGWATQDVAKNTQVSASEIAHWKEWAAELGVPLLAGEQPQQEEVMPVTTYFVEPAPQPPKRPAAPAEALPPAADPASETKPKRSRPAASAARKEPKGAPALENSFGRIYSLVGLINAAVVDYAIEMRLQPEQIGQNIEMADGIMTMTLSLPAGGANG